MEQQTFNKEQLLAFLEVWLKEDDIVQIAYPPSGDVRQLALFKDYKEVDNENTT